MHRFPSSIHLSLLNKLVCWAGYWVWYLKFHRSWPDTVSYVPYINLLKRSVKKRQQWKKEWCSLRRFVVCYTSSNQLVYRPWPKHWEACTWRCSNIRRNRFWCRIKVEAWSIFLRNEREQRLIKNVRGIIATFSYRRRFSLAYAVSTNRA